jgi:hypothetical protein
VLSSDFHFKENDVTTRAALLHQILPKTGRQTSVNHLENSDGLPVITVEAFHITKTKEGPPSVQQCQNDADCFL